MTVPLSRHVILNVNVLDFGVSSAAFEYSGLPASVDTACLALNSGAMC